VLRLGWLACGLLVACGARTDLGIGEGAREDSGTADAAELDGGRVDAAAPDASRPDAAPRDAGRPDAAKVDGGLPPEGTGVWVGPVAYPTFERTFTFVLLPRAGGDVLAYIAGGTSRRRVVSASLVGTRLVMDLRFDDPGLSHRIRVEGTFEGDVLRGMSINMGVPQPIEWRREEGALVERRLVLDAEPGGEVTELAWVEHEGGGAISGGLVGRSACTIVACAGGVLGVTEGFAGQLEIDVESGGASSTRGTIRLLPSSSGLHPGRWETTSSDGTMLAGTLTARREPSARLDDVLGMMTSLADLADALEGTAPLDAGSLPIAADYLHDGISRAELVAHLEEERLRTNRARFVELRTAVSLELPPPHASLVAPMGLPHRRITSGPMGVIADVDTDADGALRVMAMESGRWVLTGNGR
jgi:hypothetical protein